MKKKKGMALLGAVVMLLFAAVLPGMAKVKAAGPTADVSAGNVSAKIGDKISIPVTFTASEKIQGFQGTVDYDDTVLKFTGVDFNVAGLKSVEGNNFGYVIGPDDALDKGTFNLKFEVLKCTENASVVAINKVQFSTANGTGDEINVKASVTVAHPSDKQTTKVIKAATCTEKGEKQTICSVCGAVLKTEEIPAAAHKWVAGNVLEEATCTKEGKQEYTCTECREKKVETIAKKEHKWVAGDVLEEATCAKEGKQKFTCEVCQETKEEVIAKKAHEWIVDENTDKEGWKIITKATKEKEGKKERVCKNCQTVETKTLAKLSDPKKNNSKKVNTKQANNVKKATVKTGDHLKTMYLVMALLISAAVVVTVMTKRIKNKR